MTLIRDGVRDGPDPPQRAGQAGAESARLGGTGALQEFLFLWGFKHIFVQNSLNGRIAMAEENPKAIHQNEETNSPAGAEKDELLDEDVEKVAGGESRNLITTDAGT